MLPLRKGSEKRRRNYLLRVQRVSLILIGLGVGFAVLSLFMVVSAAVVLVMTGMFSYISHLGGSEFLTIHRRLKILLGVVHDLDLTTRIWSKT